MQGRSIRSPPASCRWPSAKRPRQCRSSRTAPRPTAFASAGAKKARPTMPKAQSSRRSDRRPAPSEIEAALPGFVGLVQQVPPTYSAIKIEGARAYDLARGGESFAIEARPIQVYRLAVVSAEVHSAVLEAECGKGTYIRAIARDLGRVLGCYGHVVELRRTPRRSFRRRTRLFRSTACRTMRS